MTDASTGDADLSALRGRLDSFSSDGTSAMVPAPDEAMAIYALAVRVVEAQLAEPDDAPPTSIDTTRDVLLGTRAMLRAALDRVEHDLNRRRLRLIDGERSN